MRKPVHLTAAGPKNDRQAMWEAMRALRRFSVPDIRGVLPGATNLSTIRDYVIGLERAGYLRRYQLMFGLRYELIKDIGVEAPRVRKDGSQVLQGLGQSRIWSVLRISRSPLTALEILASINSPDYQVTVQSVRTYLSHLKRAGYLLTSGSGEQMKYRLIPSRNSGPVAPKVQRSKQLFDANTGQVVTAESGGDA